MCYTSVLTSTPRVVVGCGVPLIWDGWPVECCRSRGKITSLIPCDLSCRGTLAVLLPRLRWSLKGRFFCVCMLHLYLRTTGFCFCMQYLHLRAASFFFFRVLFLFLFVFVFSTPVPLCKPIMAELSDIPPNPGHYRLTSDLQLFSWASGVLLHCCLGKGHQISEHWLNHQYCIHASSS